MGFPFRMRKTNVTHGIYAKISLLRQNSDGSVTFAPTETVVFKVKRMQSKKEQANNQEASSFTGNSTSPHYI